MGHDHGASDQHRKLHDEVRAERERRERAERDNRVANCERRIQQNQGTHSGDWGDE